MRDAWPKFEAAGIRLVAISYDDPPALREFAEKQSIPFPLLSDIDSAVIRRFGILNDTVSKRDGFLYGIPFPGAFVADESGTVVAKFFHDTYKKRESPEVLLDAALGRIELDEGAPQAVGGEPEIRITAAVHGGRGTLRQGIIRKLVVRFDLDPGWHLYGEPVPDGLIPTTIEVNGPEGLVAEDPILPPTRTLHLEGLGVDLETWSGRFDIAIPIFADGRLASEARPLDADAVPVQVKIRYQACDESQCALPRTETLNLEVPLDVVDIPRLGLHEGHGQRAGNYDARPHMQRLFLRKTRKNPLGLIKFVWTTLRLELKSRLRRRS